MSDTVTLKDEGLQKLIKAFKGKMPKTRVGIIGDDKPRTAYVKPPAALSFEQLMRRRVNDAEAPLKKSRTEPTNAEIGARWEFDPKWKRSFLRVPLMDKLEARMSAAGAFKKETILEVIKSGSITIYVERISVLALDVVLGAFASGGYGKWVPSDMTRKLNKQTLIETQQLLRSMTSDVKE